MFSDVSGEAWLRSALPLLQAWVLLIDDKALALSDDDLAVECAALNTASDFHV